MGIPLQPVDLNNLGWTPTTLETNNIANELVDKVAIATPLEELTTGALDGTGVFDTLMRTTKLHLQEEYDSERITGHEYTSVYISALTTVWQTAIQFLANRQQALLINAQIGLVRQQTVTELSNTDDSIPAGLGFNRVPTEVTTIDPDTSYGASTYGY